MPDQQSPSNSIAIVDGPNIEETFDLLSEDSEDTPVVEKKTPPVVKDKDPGDEIDEEDEPDDEEEITLSDEDDEEETPNIDDDELDLVVPARRREILAKYPNLYKDFPHLERATYREQAYTEILPTIEDAKNAKERSEVLTNYESQLLNGDTTTILKSVKESDPEAFNRIVDNYIEVLGKVDQQAQYHVTGNIIKQVIITMAQEAQRLGAENGQVLNNAAAIVNQFMFGSSNFQAPQRLSQPTPDAVISEREKLQQERTQMLTEQFTAVSGELQSKVDNTLIATINEHVDPKGNMTPYVKKQAIKETLDAVRKEIAEDTRFNSLLNNLWKKAADQRFSQDSIKKIRSVYLSKAKTLLPNAIKQTRREALKGTGTKVASSSNRQGQVSRGTSAPQRSSGKPGNITRSMSTLDIFNQD